MSNNVQVGPFLVGDGRPAIVSAELGINHGGDGRMAERLFWMARDCGCDAVKTQHFTRDDWSGNPRWRYHWKGCSMPERTLWAGAILDEAGVRLLKMYGEKTGLLYHATPFSPPRVQELAAWGVKALKIASDGIGDIPLVDACVATGLPLIVSTGCPDDALDAGLSRIPHAHPVVLLHCVRAYPVQDRDANLSRIGDLRTRYNLPIGYSDHTVGIWAGVKARYEYGACWIEKHFTTDKTAAGPDHWFSADPEEMETLVKCLT